MKCPICNDNLEIESSGVNGSNEINGIFWQDLSINCDSCMFELNMKYDGDYKPESVIKKLFNVANINVHENY